MMYKLAIIEDEHLIRKYLTTAIDYQSLDISVCGAAGNGQAGVTLIEQTQPDIVLTDINMPMMNAFEMFAATAQQSYQKVILSGYNDFDNAKQALKFGVRDFLVKPLDVAELGLCLVSVTAQIEQGQRRPPDPSQRLLKDVRQSRDPLISQMLAWIAVHYAEKITVADLAHEFGYSESYVYKKVKNHLSITLGDYLNRYRIRMAVNALIEDPNLLIYEVAQQCGFCDYKYFNQVFKKYLGMTVSDFKGQVLQV